MSQSYRDMVGKKLFPSQSLQLHLFFVVILTLSVTEWGRIPVFAVDVAVVLAFAVASEVEPCLNSTSKSPPRRATTLPEARAQTKQFAFAPFSRPSP
jgi:hypothetical protein